MLSNNNVSNYFRNQLTERAPRAGIRRDRMHAHAQSASHQSAYGYGYGFGWQAGWLAALLGSVKTIPPTGLHTVFHMTDVISHYATPDTHTHADTQSLDCTQWDQHARARGLWLFGGRNDMPDGGALLRGITTTRWRRVDFSAR